MSRTSQLAFRPRVSRKTYFWAVSDMKVSLHRIVAGVIVGFAGIFAAGMIAALLLPLLVPKEGRGGGSQVTYVWFDCGDAKTAAEIADFIDKNQSSLFQQILQETKAVNPRAIFADGASFMYGGETKGSKAGVRLYYFPWRMLRWEMPFFTGGKGGWYYGRSKETDSRNEALERACKQHLESVLMPLIREKQKSAPNKTLGPVFASPLVSTNK